MKLNDSEKSLAMTAIVDKLTQYKREYKEMTGNDAAEYKKFLDEQITTAESVFKRLDLGVLIETEKRLCGYLGLGAGDP